MLVLSRKQNQNIVINDDIVVTVVEIRGDKVRLGVVAPPTVSVHRREVWDAIHGGQPSVAPATAERTGKDAHPSNEALTWYAHYVAGLRADAPAPPPEEIRAHLAQCSSCRTVVHTSFPR